MVSGLTFRPFFRFEFSFVRGVRVVPFHPSTCGCPVSPTPFVEEALLYSCLEDVTCKLRYEEGRRTQARRCILDPGKSLCKGPEVGRACLL